MSKREGPLFKMIEEGLRRGRQPLIWRWMEGDVKQAMLKGPDLPRSKTHDERKGDKKRP